MNDVPYGLTHALERATNTLNDLLARQRQNDLRVNDKMIEYARANLGNAQDAINRYKANEAQRKAEAARQRQEQEQVAAVELDAYKAQLFAAWPGTAAEFESAWPQLKQQRQIELMNQTQQRARQEVASSGKYDRF